MIRRLVQFLPLLFAALTGCRGCNDDPRERIPMLADAAPAPALAASTRPAPTTYQQDALWSQAIEGDDIDLATLADREGASGLLDAIEVGGAVGITALAALPYAADAPVAYRRVCEIALLTQGDAQLRVVRAVHDVALEPRKLREPVDEGGRDVCVKALMHVAGDEEAPRANRALAVSTLRLPAFADLVDVSKVPVAFDTPPAASSR